MLLLLLLSVRATATAMKSARFARFPGKPGRRSAGQLRWKLPGVFAESAVVNRDIGTATFANNTAIFPSGFINVMQDIALVECLFFR